ncbi:hypothetical protein MBLNU457_6880t1 [Dothideomycetes sp. NU457]
MHTPRNLISAAALIGLAAAAPAPQQLDLGEILAAPPATISGPALSAITQVSVINTPSQIASISSAVSTVATASITGAAASNAANMAPTTTAAANKKRDLQERDLLAQLLGMMGVQVKTTAVVAPAIAPAPTAGALVNPLAPLAPAPTVGLVNPLSPLAPLAPLPTAGLPNPLSPLAPLAPSINPLSVVVPVPVVNPLSVVAPVVSAASSVLSGGQAVATTSAKSASTNAGYFTSMQLTSTTSTSTTKGSSTTTSSSSTACPTTPEEGTYCGFINPEDPCAPQPDGNGPANLTVSSFMNYAPFQSMAANAPTPSGYARTFNNMNASTSANSYLGLWTLKSYDPAACAAQCDNTTSCTSFNLYIERDPSQNPCKNDSTAPTVWGYWCPNPSAITNYKCTLWGSDIDNTTAVNAGGWREDFNVVITGSNGYDKTNYTTPPAQTAYTAPQNCSSKAIDGGSYWLGSKFFPGPYDPSLCAAYANATTIYNRAQAINASLHSYTPCNMFNALHIYKNGIPQGTHCRLYDTQLSTSWATYSGSYSGRDYYSVRNSWTYNLQYPDSGRC